MREDAQLVLAARDADQEAFSAPAARHRLRTRAVVLALPSSPVEAEDVVRDALLRAYTELGRLRDPARFGARLRGIAHEHLAVAPHESHQQRIYRLVRQRSTERFAPIEKLQRAFRSRPVLTPVLVDVLSPTISKALTGQAG
jgi:DNA-directed RNA polymerase specialized sigma24 family protein